MGVTIIIIGVVILLLVIVVIVNHQRRLRLRAYLIQEAIRNKDFTFRLSTRGMLFGEKAMQETLNQLGETIREQVNQSEVESWERLTRVLTHEMMNATAPITSISQSLLGRPDVKGISLEDGIQAIYDTSQHLSAFVSNYRKMTQLEKPILADVNLSKMIEDISKTYPELTWDITLPAQTMVCADQGMLRQVFINMVKNALEAGAHTMVVEMIHEGQPIPAEYRQSLFVPFFTTKRGGSGIGLSLSRRMMIQQGGMLALAEKSCKGCHAGFVLTIKKPN